MRRPGRPRGDYAKARILMMSGRRREALREFRRLLRRHPRDVDALFQAARLTMALGNAGRARRLLARCSRLDSKARWSREIVSELKKLE